MALGATLFAAMNFFARLASSSASWASVGAVRALVGAFVAYAVARVRGAPLAAKDRRLMLLRSILGTAAMIATFYALASRSLSLGDTATLLSLTPVFLALLAPLVLGERTSAGVAFAIALSLGGVVLILRPAALFGADGGAAIAAPPSVHGEGDTSAATTAAVALLAAFLSSIAMMLLRRMGRAKESPEAIALHFSVFAAVTLILIAALGDRRTPAIRDSGLMVAAGVCAGFAQIAITRAYALDDAARVGGVAYLSVVVSALLGAVALGERPAALTVAGMALVIAGGLVASLRRAR